MDELRDANIKIHITEGGAVSFIIKPLNMMKLTDAVGHAYGCHMAETFKASVKFGFLPTMEEFEELLSLLRERAKHSYAARMMENAGGADAN